MFRTAFALLLLASASYGQIVPGPVPTLVTIIVAQLPTQPPAAPRPVRRRDIPSIGAHPHLPLPLWGRWDTPLGRPRELETARWMLEHGTHPQDVLAYLERQVAR